MLGRCSVATWADVRNPRAMVDVGVSETKRGVELEEATVKQITGSDTISARAPYGKPFSYRPQFKLWLSTNHKPEIPDGSEAIWDRMRLIPFTQRFDGKKADADLPEKLREEFSGVLAWAVEGVIAWNKQGLGTSKSLFGKGEGWGDLRRFCA